MIVRALGDIEETERDVFWGNGRSRRFLLSPESLLDR